MAFDPIPKESPVVEGNGFLSRAWHQFLNKMFGDIFRRLDTLEETSEDHEDRITTLEP